MSKPTLEKIVWYDHVIEVGATTKRAAKKLKMAKRVSVGWVLHQSADAIMLAHTKDDNDNYADVTVLGTALVLSREVIE